MSGEDWPAYYRVTVDRPAWANVMLAADAFEAEGGPVTDLLAVDLGCGAGRDTRALLARGWRVLAVDREAAAIEAMLEATPEHDRGRLQTCVGDLEEVELPPCDLVNANVSLQFVPIERFEATLRRVFGRVRTGGRVSAMIYGDRDEAAVSGEFTCVSEDVVRRTFEGFDIESWVERDEDSTLALGDPHHLHLFEVVARRIG